MQDGSVTIRGAEFEALGPTQSPRTFWRLAPSGPQQSP
jgi:hypothetical protein